MRRHAVILTVIALGGCTTGLTREEAEFRAQFAPISTEQAFVAQATGRDWQSDEITVQFAPDGSLSGAVNGVPVTGSWRWQGALFCSQFLVGDAGGTGCSELGIRPGELLVVPLSGEGAPFTFEAA